MIRLVSRSFGAKTKIANSVFFGPGMVCVFQPELIEGKKRKYTFYSKCISNSKVLLQWSRY